MLNMIKRALAENLKQLSKSYPVVHLTGPRQSGKTTLCREVFSALPYVSLENLDIREFATRDPRGFLSQFPNGAVFDEIQKAPDIPSYLQSIVDEPGFSACYVLTGSQNFSIMNSISQTLAGRTAILQLLPFSLVELQGAENLEDSDERMFKGFYPRLYDANIRALQFYSDYVTTYVERDVRDLLKIKDLLLFQRFLKLCAGRGAQILNVSNLANDAGITQKTAKEWLTILEASYILFQIPPFYENLGKRLSKSPKLFFYDTGLMAHLLGIEDKSQIASHPLRGSLFENLVVTELLKSRLNKGLKNNLFYYRDSNNTEVDVLLPKGSSFIPIEIKSGKTINKDFFTGLKLFSKLKPEAESGVLIYDGEEKHMQYNCEIVGFKHLPKYL